MERRTQLIMGVASILAGLLLSALPQAVVPRPGVGAELKRVIFKVEGWVCFG